MSKIVVIGSLNMDLVVKAERAPRAGETVRGNEFLTIPGGKGANQAAAIARLGGQVTMVGRVGQDAFGERLKKNLDDLGVDTGHIRNDSQVATGVALIIVENTGENRILIVPGANGRVDGSDVQVAVSALRGANLLVLQLEIPMNTVSQCVEMAAQMGIPVLLNPAPAAPLKDELLAKISYLVLNESEAEGLSGIAVTNQESAEKAGHALIERGVKNVVVTLGSQGALLVTPQEVKYLPAFEVRAVDTTAAGDAFIGGFAVSCIQSLPLGECVRFGNAAGALAATKFGAQTSLPYRREVDRFLSSQNQPQR